MESATLAAPIGGLNTVDAGASMPLTDCIQLYNLIAAEYGLRSRLGYREVATGLGYSTRTAWQAATVYTAGDVITSHGYLYTCATGGTSTGTLWAASTAYVIGNQRYNGDKLYTCDTNGTSDTSGGPLGVGLNIVDGTTQWDYTSTGGPSTTTTGITDGTAVWDYFANATPVRSIIPFQGSASTGTYDRLFATDSTGIWDVTTPSETPSRVFVFDAATDLSGRGTSCVFVNSSGSHYLLYFDEENGYHAYDESTGRWNKVVNAATTAWVASTAYAYGDERSNGGNTYICKTAGTSASSGGPTGTTSEITDGTCVWDYAVPLTGVNPRNLVFGVIWQNRLWCVQRDTAKAWYGGVGAYTGTVTGFVFGGRFRAGGPLMGLYNWTIDGGSGVQNSLVAISQAGDVVIYQGTDPSSSATFGLKGVWSLGAIPVGRKVATDFGGDMLILTNTGIMPLSRLTMGNPVFDRSQYATQKIANLFNTLASTYGKTRGWSLRIHPEDNALIVTVPSAGADAATTQLTMSMATRGWSQYRDLPMTCNEVWQGKLYFGTADGRVCCNTDHMDDVRLASGFTPTPVQWAFLSAFTNLGSQRQKRVGTIAPSIISTTAGVSYDVAARWDYDLTELSTVTAGDPGTNVWDTAVWDTAIWGGPYQSSRRVRGATGMGVAVAIAMRGTAAARVSIAGVDVTYTQGGLL